MGQPGKGNTIQHGHDVGNPTARWNIPKDTKPSFTDRTVIVTGASSGLGREAALKFVQSGAQRVVLAVRSIKKGEDAKAYIEKTTSRKAVVEVWELDMLNYDSIKAFAAKAGRELERLDVAVLNAGVTKAKFEKSDYGFEQTLQVNTLSTLLLGLLLMPKLAASKTADFTPVLELVSSAAHNFVTKVDQAPGKTSLETYSSPEHFDAFTNYSVSKLLLEYGHAALTELASIKYGKDFAPGVNFVSICPGPCRSEIGREQPSVVQAVLWIFHTFFMRTEKQGARTHVSGAMLGEKGHGRF